MRGLQTHDVFVALRLVNTTGLRDEFKKMANQVANGKKLNEREVGIDFILNVLGACGNEATESLVYDFLSGIMEIPAPEIKTMDPMKLVENLKMLKEYISVEEWKSFFTRYEVYFNRVA